jgi:thioredoxin 1
MSNKNKKELPKSFNQLILKSDKPIMVNFFATWHKSCEKVSPLIKNLAREYSGKILSVKINIDKHRHVQSRYHVHDLPTIILFWKGEELFRITGEQTYEFYKEKLEEHLSVIQ